MKKILLILLLGSFYQNSNASQNKKKFVLSPQLFQHLSTCERYGILIENMQQYKIHNLLMKEIQSNENSDDAPSLIENGQIQQFARHLTHHFGQSIVFAFAQEIEAAPAEIIPSYEQQFWRTLAHFTQTRRAPKVTPQGKTLPEYIVALRDQEDK